MPQLIWYDLNPENILVDENNELLCIVDRRDKKQ